MNDDLPKEFEHWLRILDEASYYELLGILEIESQEGIRRAFRQFSESFHPDRHRGSPPGVRDAATRIFRRGAEAYGVLRDESLRSAYDVGLSQGRLRYQPGLRSPSSPSLRPEASAGLQLAELARSKAGKLHARQAERALARKSWEEARDLLEKAWLADEGNPRLKTEGEALIARVRRGEILPSG